MVVIIYGLDCFINFVLAYVHVPHIYCLIISLNWYFVNWDLNIQGCFTHILNIQLVYTAVYENQDPFLVWNKESYFPLF